MFRCRCCHGCGWVKEYDENMCTVRMPCPECGGDGFDEVQDPEPVKGNTEDTETGDKCDTAKTA